jgi:uncharacterized ion transporter superfamily protein YfcC
MKSSRFPDALVLIFFLIVGAQLISYVISSGLYGRIEIDGHPQVIPGSYHVISADPLPFFNFLTAIPRGMIKAADIIFFVLIAGGTVAVIRKTGLVDAILGAVIVRIGERKTLLIGGGLALFAVGSSTIGMAEEYLPFVSILVGVALALGMDAIVAIAIIYGGAGIGYGCAALNPFTVVIAQRIADVPIYSGQLFRWTLLLVCVLIGTHHILRYARRIENSSPHSLTTSPDFDQLRRSLTATTLTLGRVALLICCLLSIALFILGAIQWEWFLTELNAVFLGLMLLASLLGKITLNQTAQTFTEGASQLTSVALIIGFARAIEVTLNDALVIDTIIHTVASGLDSLPTVVATTGMIAIQAFINLLIPSGSGQAFVTMPIMAPLADLMGIGRESAVLAYQFGDGFTNMIIPTNALLMGVLTLAGVSYSQWIKFVFPLVVKLYLVSAFALILKITL